MNRCCANSHMSLLVGTLTLRTSLYTIHISTSIHISYDRYFCIWTQAVRNHMCLCLASVHFEALCIQTHSQVYTYIYISIFLYMKPMLCKLTYVCAPCECSHIEPFCIHQHFQKCTYIISKIHLYMNQCCANLLMTLCLWPCERSHLEPSLYTSIYSQEHISYYRNFCIWLRVVRTHICLCPCGVLTLRTSLYTHIYSQAYKYHVTDTFVYKPMFLRTHICLCPGKCSNFEVLFLYVRTLTRKHISCHRCLCIWTDVLRTHICLCPCKCSTLKNPLIYMHLLTSIHISYYRCFCVWLRVVWTHICLCPCECSHLEPLCLHAYTHKYTYIIAKIPLYVNPCCANSHTSVPLRVLALRTSLHTYICSQV